MQQLLHNDVGAKRKQHIAKHFPIYKKREDISNAKYIFLSNIDGLLRVLSNSLGPHF